MNKQYCVACGNPTEYSYDSGKPKFCSSCGIPYDGVAIASKPTPKPQIAKNIAKPKLAQISVDNEFEEDEIVKYDGGLVSLDCSIDIPKPAKTTIGSMWGQAAPSDFEVTPRKVNNKKIDQKKALEAILAETKSVRLSPRKDED